MAARLYASGAVPTKKAACKAVGLNDQYLSMLSRESVENPEILSVLDETDRAIHEKTVALSTVVALIARKAAKRMNGLIDSNNEHIALKASADILDRHPETSKTQKVAIASFSLEGQDAKELAAALVASAKVKERFAEVGNSDFVKVKEDDNASFGLLQRPRAKPVGEEAGLERDRSSEQSEDDGVKATVEEGEVG